VFEFYLQITRAFEL